MDEDEGTTFVTIYHGKTIASAKMIGVTTDPETVACVAERILEESKATGRRGDSVISHLEAGRRGALRRIIENAHG